MRDFRHLPGVTSLILAPQKCVGCGTCLTVCPHGVFALTDGRARIQDQDGCMECGACAKNCAAGAIGVTPGVGCAAYIIKTWLPWSKGGTVCC